MIVLKTQSGGPILVGENGFNEGEVTQLMSKLVPDESSRAVLLCAEMAMQKNHPTEPLMPQRNKVSFQNNVQLVCTRQNELGDSHEQIIKSAAIGESIDAAASFAYSATCCKQTR